jgi:glycosyltransferase involved in cell wall biosynthesis
MINQPLVSVIIPLYNAENYIKDTIGSVLNQTYPNIEIIVIDDHSTDQSYQLVETFQSNKIRLVKNPKKGACSARNYGFELSKGDFIQYLDADDILQENKIETQVKLIHNNTTIVASCGWNFFEDEYHHLNIKPQKINQSYSSPLNWLIDSYYGNEMGIISIWLTPRNLIEKAGGWNEDLLINQDGEFFCRVLLIASEISFCKNTMTYYRINPISITQKTRTTEILTSQLYAYQLCQQHLTNYFSNINVKKAIGNLYLKFIYLNDRNNHQLATVAWQYFNALNIGKPWKIGGQKFKFLTAIFGFKLALKLIKLIS